MASSVTLEQITTLKTNITSSLDVSPTQHYFTTVTRYLRNDSSMYTYQLDLYDLRNLTKLNSTAIYSTYNVEPHFVDFLADDQTIVVTTIYHVIFYDTRMQLKFKALHGLQDIYDLSSSPDGRLVVLVGDNKLLIWDSVTYRTIQFTPSLPQARFCEFSPDGTRFAVSYSDGTNAVTLGFYSIIMDNGQFYFERVKSITIDSTFGLINSVDFNPLNPSQIVVGFSNVSPRLYDTENETLGFTKLIDLGEQPSYKGNWKRALFLPDGKRVISSDEKGFGFWPSKPSQSLIYKEDYFFFGGQHFNKGRSAIGFVWERIKILQFQFECPPGSTSPSTGKNLLDKLTLSLYCNCPASSYWDPSSYSCLECTQNGVNICECGKGETFLVEVGRCVFDCSNIENAIKSKTIQSPLADGARCFCKPGYFWQQGACVFDCEKILYAFPAANQPQACLCINPLNWNGLINACECPFGTIYDKNSQSLCVCDSYHYLNTDTGRCVPDCTKAAVNADQSKISIKLASECPCLEGMSFRKYELPGSGLVAEGCMYDCSVVNFTIEGTPSSDCICPENMRWEDKKCKIDCTKIFNAIGEVVDPRTAQVSCTCPTNYVWVPKNLECGKNCTQVKFVNQSRSSTALSCPCRQQFEWNPLENLCVIDCEQVNYSQSYSMENKESCICRQTFFWDKATLGCVINCSEIWDAKTARTGPGECQCSKDKIFNATGLLCQDSSDANVVFSKPWVWAVLIVGIIFVIAAFVIMFRFCKKFSSEQNKEHDKRLKKGPEMRRRKKSKPKDATGTISERASIALG